MNGGRRDLSEWVAYLREIGVRELRVSDMPLAGGPSVSPGNPRESRQAGLAPQPEFHPQPQPPVAGPLLPLDAAPPSTELGDPTRLLADLREEIGECTRCKLHEQRTNIVFGVGDPGAKLMFVGEGPGAEEDARGEPFVGRAGKKLDEMIASLDLRREDVYIANIVKCRPPNNRDPEKDEVATCSPFLFAQIDAIRPRVIVALGSPATRTLLNTRIGITKLRGTWHEFRGIPIMPTFHPAYLLRAYTRENRGKVYADLLAAKARMDESP